ncbi:hypothetical protein PS2_035682 [Malus domestica]
MRVNLYTTTITNPAAAPQPKSPTHVSLSHKQQQTVFFLNSPSTPRSHGKAATPRFPRRFSRTHGCGKWQEHATSPLLTCCCIISTNSSMHSLDSLE